MSNRSIISNNSVNLEDLKNLKGLILENDYVLKAFVYIKKIIICVRVYLMTCLVVQSDYTSYEPIFLVILCVYYILMI